ncbi:MAG: metallophosphoesterase, partial [Candidatus Eremiobacteraeota bacterium]|nr:metallophosphoesterase [Candidatus Eremiobacteraeota bacterium]
MRIAVFSDIHGNLLGLDACLADLESQGGADGVVVAGDLCLGGPKPKKVLQRIEEIGAACVRGNTDRYLSEESSSEKF